MPSKRQGLSSVTWIILAFGALGVALLIYTGAGWIAAAREAAQPQPEPTLPLVELAEVTRLEQVYTISEEGFLRPRAEIEVVPEVAGRVTEVAPQLQPGGRFEKGELMFKIDQRTFAAEKARAEADLEAARSELARAREDMARQERLAEIGASSAARRQQASATLASATARVGQAEAALTLAAKQLEDTTLNAPFHASVISETVAPGRYVQPGQSVATIFDTGPGEVVLGLRPEDAAAVRRAAAAQDGPLKAAITPSQASASGTSLSGVVQRFGQSVDQRSRTVSVVIEVKNAFDAENAGDVFANDFVRVELPARAEQELYEVPNGVVREETYVWVLDDDDRFVRVDVNVVRRLAHTTKIASPVDLAAARVVLTSLTEEKEGLEVEIASEQREAVLR